MEKKMGRPPKDGNRKGERITFRAMEQDSIKIKYCCDKTGLSKSEVIRKGVDNLYNELSLEEK